VGYPPDADDEDNDGPPDPDEAPETPLDEPPPPHVEEPPPPQPKGPYVVVGYGSGPTISTEDGTVNTGERKERRGFASMSPEKQREIASKGGRAAHEKGTAHEWTADEARSAGRKGGQVSRGGRGRLLDSSTPPSEGEPTARPDESIQ
jgi:uncharacterized protein